MNNFDYLKLSSDLIDGETFAMLSLTRVYGGIPMTSGPVDLCPITDSNRVREFIWNRIHTPPVQMPELHSRDYRKGLPPFCSTYSKYKTYKSYGLHSLGITLYNHPRYDFASAGIIRGDGGKGWIDLDPPISIEIPHPLTSEILLEAYFDLVMQAKRYWDDNKS